MLRTLSRKLLWIYALLMLIAALGYARYDLYMMDGDGTAFVDIAQDLNTHHAPLAINAYWNPGYAAVVAVAERIAHPSLWRELVVVRYANVFIFLLAMAATVFFTTALTQARRLAGEHASAVPDRAIHLLGLALLVLSLGRELPVAAPRADTLLFALLMAAAALVLHIVSGQARLSSFALLGLTLGCAYLTKSFAFLPSVALVLAFLLYAVVSRTAARNTIVVGAILCAAMFGITAGPYILAISHQLGHFTTGESARLNYAFFIDMTPRWHEWFHKDLGQAAGTFLHPETPLTTDPPVFSYAAHPFGTFPLWFDPAWWTLGLKPHIWLKGHAYRLVRNIVVFFRYLLGRPEIFVLYGVILAFGAKFMRRSTSDVKQRRQNLLQTTAWVAFPAGWGLLMLAIYFPIDLQDRYLTAPLFLVVLPLFAALRSHPEPATAATNAPDLTSTTQLVACATIVLFAGITIAQSATYLADRRRHTPPAEQHHPGFDPQVFTAAAALDKLGLHPGDKVACMGDLACYTDFYWARLAGTQILGEVETPNEQNPITEWNSIPDKSAITQPLASMGLRYIVSIFPNSATKPAGWIQLGPSNFFAYPLQSAITPQVAAKIESYLPIP